MKPRRPRFRWLAIAVLTGWLVCSAMPAAAWAQKKRKGAEAPAGPAEQSYVLPYFLVVLTMGLGLAVVCRPSRRQQFQSVVYQEKTDLVHGK